MQFPRLVYKSASVHLIANDRHDFDAAILAGWFESVPDAMAEKLPVVSPVPDDNAPPTRAEMEAKAASLGLKFDGRTGNSKLLKMIADHGLD